MFWNVFSLVHVVVHRGRHGCWGVFFFREVSESANWLMMFVWRVGVWWAAGHVGGLLPLGSLLSFTLLIYSAGVSTGGVVSISSFNLGPSDHVGTMPFMRGTVGTYGRRPNSALIFPGKECSF